MAAPSRRCPTCRRSRGTRFSRRCRRSTSEFPHARPVRVENLPYHLTPWKAGGFKAWDFCRLAAHDRCRRSDRRGCSSLTALPDLSALTSLQTLNLGRLASWLLPHGAARPVGAHVAADAQPHELQIPSRRCPTCRRSQTLDLCECKSLTAPARPRGAHVAAEGSTSWLLPHGAGRPVGAHVVADAVPRYCRSFTALPVVGARARCRRSTSVAAAPSRRCPTSRRSRRCRRSTSSCCESLTALPDLSALTSLQELNLVAATPSRRCPTCRRSRRSRNAGRPVIYAVEGCLIISGSRTTATAHRLTVIQW